MRDAGERTRVSAKSNQGGIETASRGPTDDALRPGKIEPRWD